MGRVSTTSFAFIFLALIVLSSNAGGTDNNFGDKFRCEGLGRGPEDEALQVVGKVG